MKKILVTILVLGVITPQVAFAAWWNPITWQIFKKNIAPTQEITHSNFATSTEKNNLVRQTNHISSTTPSSIVDTPVEPMLMRSVFIRSLSLGMEGLDVEALQVLLANDKSIYPEGKITGNFDIATKKAVQRFQDKYNLASSEQKLTANYGAVGPKTLKMLETVFSGVKVVTVTKATPTKTIQQNSMVTKPNLQNDIRNNLQKINLSQKDTQTGTTTAAQEILKSSSSTFDSTSKPTCTLLYNDKPVGPAGSALPIITNGEKITLSWASKFADSAEWVDTNPKEKADLQGTRQFTQSVNEQTGSVWSKGIIFTNKNGIAICHAEAKTLRTVNASFSAGGRTPNADLSYPIPTCTMTADKSNIKVGDSVTITWSSTNADYGRTWEEPTHIPTSGTQTFTNVQSRSFGMAFYGKGGRATCDLEIKVI